MNDTITAISTPPGTGGIAVIRMSGPEAFDILAKVWKGASPESMKSHTLHLGKITDGDNVIDEAVVAAFRQPNSFTGENVVEISCHGSRWIQREIICLLIRNGARAATPGEFSQRAFLNGHIDLTQAEGIADLISASSRAAHRLAMLQTDGTFSRRIDTLRDRLIDLASLLELELDFSEEDVEFANRRQLREIADETLRLTERLACSYAAGRAFKEGIPVVIAGEPNAGKSTLLNRLLEEEKAIVTDIPGTTRDIIEGTREIDGVLFRFIDTAGLRDTDDTVERIGIERANDRLRNAAVILWMIDSAAPFDRQLDLIRSHRDHIGNARQIILLNKSDIAANRERHDISLDGIYRVIPFSATEGEGHDKLLNSLKEYAEELSGSDSDIMVTNARHYEALIKGEEALRRVRASLDTGLSADFIAQDVREALHHLSAITGRISTPTLLSTIFSRFCIGK